MNKLTGGKLGQKNDVLLTFMDPSKASDTVDRQKHLEKLEAIEVKTVHGIGSKITLLKEGSRIVLIVLKAIK